MRVTQRVAGKGWLDLREVFRWRSEAFLASVVVLLRRLSFFIWGRAHGEQFTYLLFLRSLHWQMHPDWYWSLSMMIGLYRCQTGVSSAVCLSMWSVFHTGVLQCNYLQNIYKRPMLDRESIQVLMLCTCCSRQARAAEQIGNKGNFVKNERSQNVLNMTPGYRSSN